MENKFLLEKNNDVISAEFIDFLLKIRWAFGYKIGHIKYIQKFIVFVEDAFNNRGLDTFTFFRKIVRTLHWATGNTVYYVDYINGNDANDGSNWANAIKNIQGEAFTAGDVLRVAKSPDPTSIGNATWNNKSSVVTLATAQNKTIDNCEIAWTAANSAVILRDSQGKTGTYCMRITTPASTAIGTKYAYYNIVDGDYSGYQKISFWMKANQATLGTHWKLCLCSDDAGSVVVDTFEIPVIPIANFWQAIVLERVGGGNLGADIRSVALYSNTVAPAVSKNVTLDNIVACTTSGLNHKMMISKNSLAQGGEDNWACVNHIDGININLDTYCGGNSLYGRGYYGDTETVETYMRTPIEAGDLSTTTSYFQYVDSYGEAGNLIDIEGGFNTTTSEQDGESYYLAKNSGVGYGIQFNYADYVKIRHMNFARFNYGCYVLNSNYGDYDFFDINCCSLGFYLYNCIQSTINLNSIRYSGHGAHLKCTSISNYQSNITLTVNKLISNYGRGLYLEDCYNIDLVSASNISNNGSYGFMLDNICGGHFGVISNCNENNYGNIYMTYTSNNTFDEITNANYATGNSIEISSSHDNVFEKILSADGSTSSGIRFSYSNKNIIKIAENINNNGQPGIYFNDSNDNIILSGSAGGNVTAGIFSYGGGDNVVKNFNNTNIEEAGFYIDYALIDMGSIKSCKNDSTADNHIVYYKGATLKSQIVERHTASGIAWELEVDNSIRNYRNSIYTKLAEVAVEADSEVTIKVWMKKSHATNIGGGLLIRGGQLSGMTLADYADNKADDTDWEELSLSFTPTETGVIDVMIRAWSNGTTASIYFDDFSVTQ